MTKQLSKEEWEHDSKGKQAIDFHVFNDSMWQLVDHWTETVEEGEYVAMFKRLVQGTTWEHSGGLKWREDKDITYDPFFAFMEEMSAEAQEDEKQGHAHGLDDEDIDQVRSGWVTLVYLKFCWNYIPATLSQTDIHNSITHAHDQSR